MWAKKDDRGRQLSLVSHLLDVAFCFRNIISFPQHRFAFSRYAGRELTGSDVDVMCALAALHDIGKMNPRFQRGEGGHLLHGLVYMIRERLILKFPALQGQDVQKQAICAMMSHHGVPVWENFQDLVNAHNALKADSQFYNQAVQNIDSIFSALELSFPKCFTDTTVLPEAPEFWHHFTGLLTIADQVGSGVERFPIVRDEDRRPDAKEAVFATNVQGIFAPDQSSLSAADIFGWPAQSILSPVQQMMQDLPLSDRLILVESETGSGKTEAALVRYKALMEAGAVTGMYFAIPTRSSAVQIQRRVHAAVNRLYGADAALAVPGYLLVGSDQGRRTGPFEVVWGDDGKPDESRWAADAPRKYLCAPIAVGTIDQALYAVIKNKWAHMRGSALTGKLLVIDEVHASDVYMTELMKRLMRDHLSTGGHVLLMSATLTTERRYELFETCGAAFADREEAPYPAVSSLRDTAQIVVPVQSVSIEKRVLMTAEDAMTDPEHVARMCIEAADRGGRVLVIRNSVRGAMDVFDAIRSLKSDAPLLSVNGQQTVHHSRYAPADRRALDAAVEFSLGKNSSAPVIVIGTQTLEQSLDIDADLLITDVCPIDVLLQRIGRLHRHVRERLDHFKQARCCVLHADGANEKILRQNQIGKDRAYAEVRMISEVLKIIEERQNWVIPRDNRYLVDRGACDHLLDDQAYESEGRKIAMRHVARSALLDRHQPIHEQTDFSSHHGTRLGASDVTLVLDPPQKSPLGTGLIFEIQMPSWACGKNLDPELPARTEEYKSGEGFILNYGGRSATYTSKGLKIVFDA